MNAVSKSAPGELVSDLILRVFQEASRPLSVRHIAAMLPDWVNIDSAGSLIYKLYRDEKITKTSLDGRALYAIRVTPEDKPFLPTKQPYKRRSRPLKPPALIRVSPLLIDPLSQISSVANNALDVAVKHRTPHVFTRLLGQACRALDEARAMVDPPLLPGLADATPASPPCADLPAGKSRPFPSTEHAA